MQVDPLAHAYSDLTPYQYAGNNPALFNDPYGDKISGGNMFARMYDGFHAWQGGHSAQGFDNWMNSSGSAGINDIGGGGGQGYYAHRVIEEEWLVDRDKDGNILDEIFVGYVIKGGGHVISSFGGSGTTMNVLSSWLDGNTDWFVESTVIDIPGGTKTIENAVRVTYNSAGNVTDLTQSRQRTTVWIIYGTIEDWDKGPTVTYQDGQLSPLMLEWMLGGKDYRCGQCLSGQTFEERIESFFMNQPNTKKWYEPVPLGKPNVVSNPRPR